MAKIGIMGDSKVAGTAAPPTGPQGCDELLKMQYPGDYVKFATKAEDIAHQLGLWNALSTGDQESFDYIFMEVGNNDFNYNQGAAQLMPKIQELVDQINTDKKTGCEVICNIFTPVRGQWEIDYTEQQVLDCISNWDEIYDAHLGNGAYALTGVDRMIDEHVAILCEDYYLKEIYWEGGSDHLHPNRAGRDIIADMWYKYLNGFTIN